MDQIPNVLPDLALFGIPLAAVIVMIVQGLKEVGMPSKYAKLANGVLSVVAYALVELVSRGMIDPNFVQWGLFAIVLFLVNAGLYDSVIQPAAERLAKTPS